MAKSERRQREDGSASETIKVRLGDDEIAFLQDIELHVDPDVKRRGHGPAIHRLIALARAWDELHAKRLREYLRTEELTVEQFAELAELRPWTVRDILTLKTRHPDEKTVAKIRRFTG